MSASRTSALLFFVCRLLVFAAAAQAQVPAPPSPAAAPGAAEPYSLQGPLRYRDMTAFHLTRLEMVPTESSAALGDGWTFESDLTHSNSFGKSSTARDYLAARTGRKPITSADVENLLAIKGDVFYVDGEIGLLATTVHYKSSERLSFFITLPVYYYTGGGFDAAVERFHSTFGLGQGERDRVPRNEFNVVYRVGREQVVESGSPGSGLSDPILGARYRILPPRSPWDLIVETAVKVATHAPGALSTGGSDLGAQVALHRTFLRQAFYLDVSAVHLGGAMADPHVDRRFLPAYVAAYEFGLTHHTSLVLQGYMSPSVFSRSDVADLVDPRYEVLAGLRSQHGPLTWYVDFVENLIHNENTPDVGAQLGLTWKLGRAEGPSSLALPSPPLSSPPAPAPAR